ncbi:hypothetical protein C4Q26_20040 [Pseudomonas sp. SWI44]|nr:hypothetical protein C4Q26_20040 [Pseudomonas sp. SWI44]
MLVAKALGKVPIRLLCQPDWRGREYDIDQDSLWQHEVKSQPIDTIAWDQCDHPGTPMELTDHHGEVAWAGQYKAWGDVREVRSDWAKQVGMTNPIRFQGQYHDHETGLHYNRYRYYDPNIAKFISRDPIGLLGGTNLYQYAPNPLIWIDPLGLSSVTVGRWMGPSEYDQMTSAGRVVQSYTGTTHVVSPVSIEAFGKQAKPGTKYFEFNVPEASLIKTNEGWAKNVGPDSLEVRLAKRKGNPIPEMTFAEGFRVKAHKQKME